jgi:adenylate cyclase
MTTLGELARCFEGAVPAVVATAAADGTPNVTYLSRVRAVDPERVALSNQFFSKTARNLAENPRASLLLIDPTTFQQFRLALTYERTDRRGPVFEQLREDVDVAAALQGMQGVFKLRAADVYRVLDIEEVRTGVHARGETFDALDGESVATDPDLAILAGLAARIGRCPDLDTVVDATLAGLADLGYEHSILLLVDESGRELYTLGSHGYPTGGVGSEVRLGEGVLGAAAERCQPIRLGNVVQLARYSQSVRRSYEEQGALDAGTTIPLPGLPDAQSQVAVPAMSLGELVGVLAVESTRPVAYGPGDEAGLTLLASIVAAAVEAERSGESAASARTPALVQAVSGPSTEPTHVRFFASDGSTFVDGDYLIRGVAGRLLWSLLEQHERDGRVDFTNREVRLDPALELPEFKDNLETRLILLKRRLDERGASVRIEKTGRGRFRLVVDGPVSLERRD